MERELDLKSCIAKPKGATFHLKFFFFFNVT